MHQPIFILGLVLIIATLLDGFETILLPRRINHRLRYSRFYYRSFWFLWRRAAILLPGKGREAMLSVFGPLSMLGLFVSWIFSLVLGFALLHWAMQTVMEGGSHPANAQGFSTYLYFSGTTFITLGLGDVTPDGKLARFLTAFEAGLGFGFLAVIISYLPILYQAFSKREVIISLMDARAGSPPSAGQFLLRIVRGKKLNDTDSILREWEHWSAELLEAMISFPVLAYYRSQHANQSWLATLATMLDTCAFLLTTLKSDDSYQAQLTFAMARHAAVDITVIFGITPQKIDRQRLNHECRLATREMLRDAQVTVNESAEAEARLTELRGMYEPFLAALAEHFVLSIPPMLSEDQADNWQRSAWMPRPPKIGDLPAVKAEGDHFG